MTPRALFEPSRGQRVPVLLWARAVSHETERLLVRTASQPYVVDHVAAMADAHASDGVCVGTVFATERTVVPGALGGDLGCGMSALRFDGVDAASLGRGALARILDALARAIPVGDAAHDARDAAALPDAVAHPALSTRALERSRATVGRGHFGTLGGGNHFVELDRDAAGGLWVLVHTGSRGLGGAIALHHRRAAEAHNPGSSVPALAGLDSDAPAGRAYLADLAVALAFARENRRALLARAIETLADATGATPDAASAIDVHHNFVERETHGGRELLVHRKGATQARDGQRGIVPGSMATATYLVRGRGASASFASCSHGAGRVLTRREARATISPRALEHAMKRVVFERARTPSLVEEAPQAYRDIGHVLEDQRDLIEPTLRLEPLAVLKG